MSLTMYLCQKKKKIGTMYLVCSCWIAKHLLLMWNTVKVRDRVGGMIRFKVKIVNIDVTTEINTDLITGWHLI